MRMISQAIRAVIVEAMGVILVLWLLFGGAAWTVQHYNSSHNRQPAATGATPLQQLFGEVQTGLRGLAQRGESERRPGEVARLLDHYSNLYSAAAVDHLNRVVN